ncbi:MAG: glucose-6-phosphate dehydrogenase assembly protein OpcA [Candidatus Gracilibacteria bacterium]|nr:glucose-6-phosphate dehydrogenase assembly protein OpcA [Candidatus Gracilibacteria bacterium]
MSSRIAIGPRQVAPPFIESELEKLWIAMPRAGGKAASASMTMRAIVANLVAVCGSDQETSRAMEVIGNVIGCNPCRVILVTSEPDIDPPELSAEVAIICQESETCQRCVYCDRIQLVAHGIMADNLPSLAAALLVPDLPVVVWWPKPPFDRKDFLLFAKHAERMIVDSSGYTEDDLRALARFVEQSRRMGVAVGDLNWGRLTPYRQLFAQFFDSMECRDHLAMIGEVRVEGHAATGRLLAGWLKAQMDKSGHSLPRERIQLIATDPAGFAFRSLVMTCAGGADTFAVTRANDCALEARATLGAKTWSNVVKAGCQDVGKLLTDEITLSGRDAVFESALLAAAAL